MADQKKVLQIEFRGEFAEGMLDEFVGWYLDGGGDDGFHTSFMEHENCPDVDEPHELEWHGHWGDREQADNPLYLGIDDMPDGVDYLIRHELINNT